MNTQRLQHVVPATIIFGLSIIVAWLSFTEEPAAAYTFPRIISIIFIALAVWNFIRAATGLSRVGRGIDFGEAKNILPGMVIMLLLVFWGAKALGFYVASSIAFFAAYSFYDPTPLSSVKDWAKRAVVTLLFMTVIYVLFSSVLQVHTPRGLFF